MMAETHTVQHTERILYLRTVDVLSELTASELAAIAEQMTERMFDPGDVLVELGQPVKALYVVIEGQVALWRDERIVARAGRRAGVAALGLLANTPARFRAVAEKQTLALELQRDLLVELLSDNFPMLHRMLRLLASNLGANRRRSGASAGYSAKPEEATACPAQELDLVERLFFLREAMTFAGRNVSALADWARQAIEVRLEPGEVLWRQDDDSASTELLYCGTVRGEVDGGAQTFYFTAGASIGAIDALADEPRWYTATAVTDVVALRLANEHLLDVLEDRFEMANDFMAMVAAELLDVLSDRSDALDASVGSDTAPNATLLPDLAVEGAG